MIARATPRRRAGAGWQTAMADLALILFAVTAAGIAPAGQPAALSRAAAVSHPAGGSPLAARGEPVAVYRAGSGAPPLARWLESQAPDRRQRLTIVARHPPGAAAVAAQAALALARQADGRAGAARIVIEPGGRSEVFAVLAYDAPPGEWHEDCLPEDRRPGANHAAGPAGGKDSRCR